MISSPQSLHKANLPVYPVVNKNKSPSELILCFLSYIMYKEDNKRNDKIKSDDYHKQQLKKI